MIKLSFKAATVTYGIITTATIWVCTLIKYNVCHASDLSDLRGCLVYSPWECSNELYYSSYKLVSLLGRYIM